MLVLQDFANDDTGTLTLGVNRQAKRCGEQILKGFRQVADISIGYSRSIA